MNPIVSVIVPLYNAALYIREALESIVASTYRPIQVIVVDDGSTDDSLAIAKAFATEHPEIEVLSQHNAGASAARNRAIRHSTGTYILPVDADDTIDHRYIAEAVAVLESRPDVRVVSCRADFFGDRTGEWLFPQFSKQLLARKNMIATSAMYRRADWERTQGYMESCPAREDWDMWLSLFELGGEFVRLPNIRLHYRVRAESKRVQDRALKHKLVDEINRRHPAYMQQYLGGPLHYHRSWSIFLNRFRRIKQQGSFDDWNNGEVLSEGRNRLLQTNDVVIKHFAVPPFYQAIGRSKAQRSYSNALRLGEMTPKPIAFFEERYCGLLCHSAYVSARSANQYTFRHLIDQSFPGNREQTLQSVGTFIARLHNLGCLHQDLSPGNILVGDSIEIVDLNRIKWKSSIGIREGLRNFERLNIDRQALSIMVEQYAAIRHIDAQQAIRFVIEHRWQKHIKRGVTNLDKFVDF